MVCFCPRQMFSASPHRCHIIVLGTLLGGILCLALISPLVGDGSWMVRHTDMHGTINVWSFEVGSG